VDVRIELLANNLVNRRHIGAMRSVIGFGCAGQTRGNLQEFQMREIIRRWAEICCFCNEAIVVNGFGLKNQHRLQGFICGLLKKYANCFDVIFWSLYNLAFSREQFTVAGKISFIYI
jgi:hypothetical protein